jgi:malate dehydrogenase (quinone)
VVPSPWQSGGPITPASDSIGVIQQGTELVVSADKSIAGLLGASPGASTAVPSMIDLLQRCFPNDWRTSWNAEMTIAIPALAISRWDTTAVDESDRTTTPALHLTINEG